MRIDRSGVEPSYVEIESLRPGDAFYLQDQLEPNIVTDGVEGMGCWRVCVSLATGTQFKSIAGTMVIRCNGRVVIE